jgi:hypothetical protein
MPGAPGLASETWDLNSSRAHHAVGCPIQALCWLEWDKESSGGEDLKALD